MDMVLIQEGASVKSDIFHFMTISVMPRIFVSWQLCHNMLCGWQMSYSQIFGFCCANLDEVNHPQSWRVHMWSFWDITFFYGASNVCTKLLPNPCGHVLHNCHLVLRRKQKTKNKMSFPMWASSLKDIGSHIWATHEHPPPKTSKCQRKKNSTC